ncbi:MAG: TIR domain-containing protein [Planctomycetota bacterium]
MAKKKASKKKATKKKVVKKAAAKSNGGKRSYVSQSTVPIYSLKEAMRIADAIAEHYGSDPSSPLDVASALEMAPKAGTFRNLSGSSIAYGLTSGGWNAAKISLTPLGRRVTRPLEEGDDLAAKREALLKPTVIGEFLKKYDTSPIPREDIGQNVLAGMGVPSDRTSAVLKLIIDGAEELGLIRIIKTKKYVHLAGVAVAPPSEDGEEISEDDPLVEVLDDGEENDSPPPPADPVNTPTDGQLDQLKKRVFITHGKNKDFIDPIKKLLGFGELTPVVSVEKQSVSKPVPDKVMDDMRSCGAAIIHVDGEQTLVDAEANQHTVINPNVLIEIGAAMALYKRRFILLVRDGVKLPSNLQGLYEVRYEGDSLDGTVTIALLEAINALKKEPLPER